jgi:hypothetical protein
MDGVKVYWSNCRITSSAILITRGYPRINPDDYELEWWVPLDFYQKRVQALFNSQLTSLDQYELQDAINVGD